MATYGQEEQDRDDDERRERNAKRQKPYPQWFIRLARTVIWCGAIALIGIGSLSMQQAFEIHAAEPLPPKIKQITRIDIWHTNGLHIVWEDCTDVKDIWHSNGKLVLRFRDEAGRMVEVDRTFASFTTLTHTKVGTDEKEPEHVLPSPPLTPEKSILVPPRTKTSYPKAPGGAASVEKKEWNYGPDDFIGGID